MGPGGTTLLRPPEGNQVGHIHVGLAGTLKAISNASLLMDSSLDVVVCQRCGQIARSLATAKRVDFNVKDLYLLMTEESGVTATWESSQTND